jgi:hypothetical protein
MNGSFHNFRRRVRRTGWRAGVLLVTTGALTLVLAQVFHLNGAAAEVAIVGGLPGLYLMWSAYRDDRLADAETQADLGSLVRFANDLAVAVDTQWKNEAAVRRLNDPYPLPVRWVAAEPQAAADWAALISLATTGAGWPVPDSMELWASGHEALAGQGEEIAGLLERIPTGRLVVLGDRGTGKTMILIRLLLDLLARRPPGGPVPVLVSLASWNPARQSLYQWLIPRLALDYHLFTDAAWNKEAGVDRLRAMLDAGLILPLLDGLDEMPDNRLPQAITRINDALRPSQRLVLASRGKPYRQAVRPPDGQGITLVGAAAVELCPLRPEEVKRYLLHDSRDPARWAPIIEALGSDVPVGRALTTPLMVTLARAIYSPRPGDQPGTTRDPSELCDETMPDVFTVAQYLLDAFIPAVYRQLGDWHERRRVRWPSPKAERWLTFLARHIERTNSGDDFAWWELPGEIVLFVKIISAMLVGGVGVALGFAVTASLGRPWATELAAIFVSGVAAEGALILARVMGTQSPITGIRWRLLPRRRRVAVGLAIILIAPIAGMIIGNDWMLALAWITACVIIFGLRGVYGRMPIAASPGSTLIGSRNSALIFLFAGAAYGVVAAFAYGSTVRAILSGGYGPTAEDLAVIAGVSAGVFLGLSLSLVRFAWPRWVLARAALASTGNLPWRLVSFLEDAHKRGVLRQAGAFYQFRHVELQRRLVERSGGVIRTSLLGLTVYGADGSGAMRTVFASSDMGSRSSAVAWVTGDFTGTGRTQIAQLVNTSRRLGLTIYGIDTSGAIETAFKSTDMSQGPWALAWLTGDFTGTGRTQIAQPWNSEARLGLIVYGADASGAMRTVFASSDMGSRSSAVAWVTGDFTGTGRTQIAQLANNSGRLGLTVYGADASGAMRTVFASSDMGSRSSAVAWVTGDFTGTGRTQIAQLANNSGRLGLTIYEADASGAVQTGFKSTDMSQGPLALAWATGDFTGTGRTQIAQLANNSGRLGLTVYGADASGAMRTVFASSDMDSRSSAVAWVTGDFTGTGRTQIAQLANNSGRLGLTIYEADASGAMRTVFASSDMDSRSSAVAWVTGDFTGTGRTQIAQPWNSTGPREGHTLVGIRRRPPWKARTSS